MKITRLFTLLAAVTVCLSATAQPLIPDAHNPDAQNVRVSYLLSFNDDTDGDPYDGFEVAYASAVYPLDQMVLSYGQEDLDRGASHRVLLSVEEWYEISEVVIPYGVAGFGYLWADDDQDAGGDTTGWIGKLGAGLLVKTGTAFDFYAEASYMASDRNLWVDGDKTTSDTFLVLAGVRFNY